MNDSSNGGQGDKVSILLQNGSSILFSSNWNGSKTVLQTLSGGNVQVKNSTTNSISIIPTTAARVITSIVNNLSVKVMPNPSSYYFKLGLKSGSNEKVTITVVDILGRTVELRNDVAANSNVQLGRSYHPGVYFAQVVQGKDIVILKLIKEGK
jgi:hypothetical protein